MRNNDPIFWPDSDIDLSLRQGMQANYTRDINVLQTQWTQADMDQRTYLGECDIWGQLFPGATNFRRKMFNFNIVNPVIQSITGQQRQTRKSSICIPIHNGAQKTSDQLTKCLYYIHNQSGAYQVYSDCLEMGALVQGFGLVSIFPDMSNDPISGDIRIRNVDFKSVLIDPWFRNHDLSDCRYIWTRQFFGKEEAALAYPKFADDILALPSGTYRDDKFYYMPEVYQIQYPNVIGFDEYWYLSTRQCEWLIDTETEECQEFNGDEEDLRIIMQSFRGRLKLVTKPKPTVRRTIVINDKVLVDEERPYGLDRYSYAFLPCYFSPDTPYYGYKFRGVVRDMRDPQYLLNRRKVADLDILESQQQGLKIKKGALVTPEDGLNTGNGRILMISDKAQMSDVEPMPINPPSPVLLQMEEMLMDIAYRVAGVDPKSMGIEIDDKAGIITMMRQAANARNLQKIFDQFDEFQRQCGDIMIEMVQKLWTYGKVKQVINEEPTAEFDNKAFFKYGCKVAQGMLTESQKQLELAQLLHLREVTGIPIPSSAILEATTIQNKDKLIEAIMKQEEAQQQQQEKVEQLQMQQMQIDNQAKISYAHSQEGLTAERLAKIELDKAVNAERIQRAEEDKARAILDLVKAVKELKDMDMDRLRKGMEMVIMQETHELSKNQITETKNEMVNQ